MSWERGLENPKMPPAQPNRPPRIRLPSLQPPRLVLRPPPPPPRGPPPPQARARPCPPESGVREGVMRQVAGVVVGGGGGGVQAEGWQGGHAEVLGGVVGTEAAQVILGDGAGRHHVVDGPLQAAAEQGDGHHPTLSPPTPPGEMSPPPRGAWGTPDLAGNGRILQHPLRPHPSPLDSLERREAGVLDHGAGGQPEGVGGPQEVGGDGGAPRFFLHEGGL